MLHRWVVLYKIWGKKKGWITCLSRTWKITATPTLKLISKIEIMLLWRWSENSATISDYYEATVPKIHSVDTLKVLSVMMSVMMSIQVIDKLSCRFWQQKGPNTWTFFFGSRVLEPTQLNRWSIYLLSVAQFIHMLNNLFNIFNCRYSSEQPQSSFLCVRQDTPNK